VVLCTIERGTEMYSLKEMEKDLVEVSMKMHGEDKKRDLKVKEDMCWMQLTNLIELIRRINKFEEKMNSNEKDIKENVNGVIE
jgi:hypothetical protein